MVQLSGISETDSISGTSVNMWFLFGPHWIGIYFYDFVPHMAKCNIAAIHSVTQCFHSVSLFMNLATFCSENPWETLDMFVPFTTSYAF